MPISIHAPTKGATLLTKLSPFYLGDFNPRSHKGSDSVKYSFVTSLIISIHAPTKGATIADLKREIDVLDFNPRSHKGSDGGLFYGQCQPIYFNPRSHKGSDRQAAVLVLALIHDFNPRSHKGSDGRGVRPYFYVKEFQSTLPQRERHQKTNRRE